MLRVEGGLYNLTDNKDREDLHKAIDKWVEDNYEERLMSGEFDTEIARIHELISEEDREKLHGTWFEGNLVITHWYEPITGYLDDMEIPYTITATGDVDMYYGGKHIVFTRGTPYEEDVNQSYELCTDGIIRRDTLEKYGLYYVKDYYLPRVG